MTHEINAAEIDRVMDLHAPQHPETTAALNYVRASYKNLASKVIPGLPVSKETSLAFTKLRESLMYAIAAIACNQNEGQSDA